MPTTPPPSHGRPPTSGDRPVLLVISASTRPVRKSTALASWLRGLAEEQGAFAIDVVELAELNLPLLDEPHHPRLQRYEHEHTKAWSRRVGDASAVVFVTPEYNHSYPAGLKNAIDYLNVEWRDKPLGYLTYGGVSAGTRAMVALQPVTAALGMRVLQQAVNVPFVANVVDEAGSVDANETMTKSAQAMLAALAKAVEDQRLLRAQPTA